MSKVIYRAQVEPRREGLDWHQTWEGEDRGLIACWEVGRKMALESSELAERCKAGELPPLNWKGGCERTLKNLDKVGALQYLAQWQALRGEELNIDLDAEVTLTCSKTRMKVTFTADLKKLADA